MDATLQVETVNCLPIANMDIAEPDPISVRVTEAVDDTIGVVDSPNVSTPSDLSAWNVKKMDLVNQIEQCNSHIEAGRKLKKIAKIIVIAAVVATVLFLTAPISFGMLSFVAGMLITLAILMYIHEKGKSNKNEELGFGALIVSVGGGTATLYAASYYVYDPLTWVWTSTAASMAGIVAAPIVAVGGIVGLIGHAKEKKWTAKRLALQQQLIDLSPQGMVL